MTNREEALQLLTRIRVALKRGTLAYKVNQLGELVGRAQNGPPDGEGDNTMSEALWTECRDAYAQFCGFLQKLERIEEEV